MSLFRIALFRFTSYTARAGMLLLCASVFSFSAPAVAADPLDSLASVQKGMDTCDSDAVTRVLDIPAVVGKASDALVDALQQQAADGNLGDSNLAMLIALAGVAKESGQASMINQLLVSEVRGFIVSGVNGGYFAGSPNGSIKPSRTSLAGTLDKIPRGRRQILPGRVLSQESGTARVTGTFVDPKAGSLPLELVMEEQGGVWRVVEIANARALFQEAARNNRK